MENSLDLFGFLLYNYLESKKEKEEVKKCPI